MKNVVISQSGQLKLVDIEDVSAFAQYKSESPVFTPAYLKPEYIAENGRPDLPDPYQQSDMKYAFGVLLSMVFLHFNECMCFEW